MIIKCKMCGGDIDFTPGATYGTCEYCGSTSTIPQADDEQKLNRYNRANHFRRQCEFDKTVAAYERIIEQDDTDAEAHWGAVLSRFGIEYKKRKSILKLLAEGKGIKEMSRTLGRSAGKISWELKRNSGKDGYWPNEAEQKYHIRRKRCCRKRILDDPATKSFVQRKILEDQWSPEQISNRAMLENSPYQVSFTTIYRAIYAGRLETRKLTHGERGIARKLRHRGKTRHRKGKEETRGKLRISHPIEERPQAANDRSELGHWEADTVAGKTGSSCLITLACRKSRLLLSLKTP